MTIERTIEDFCHKTQNSGIRIHSKWSTFFPNCRGFRDVKIGINDDNRNNIRELRLSHLVRQKHSERTHTRITSEFLD